MTITMYHGTTRSNARSIKREGFRPSSSGMLGPGVYCSRDINKARQYGGSNGVILRLEVSVGKVYVINNRSDRNSNWQNYDYDTAWVKPGVQDSGEEDCVRDPGRIQVVDYGLGNSSSASISLHPGGGMLAMGPHGGLVVVGGPHPAMGGVVMGHPALGGIVMGGPPMMVMGGHPMMGGFF